MEATLQIESLEAQLATVDIVEICAWCQRIKIKGNLFHKTHWVSRDAVELPASGVLFSHGICPECKRQMTEG